MQRFLLVIWLVIYDVFRECLTKWGCWLYSWLNLVLWMRFWWFGWRVGYIHLLYRYNQQSECGVNVPLPDGSEAAIKQRSVYDCKETLGVWSCPAGTENKQYKKILGRMEKWHSRTVNGHLPAKFAWVSYRLKLWPGIRYGLATMATPLKIATNLLSNYHYHMHSYLGVNKNI